MLSPTAQQGAIVAVFAVVYLGMFLGGLPRLKLDRSGVALVGAIAVNAITSSSVADGARAVDLPTIVLLFAFMVLSAQMRLGGFYTAVTRRVAAAPLSRRALLRAPTASRPSTHGSRPRAWRWPARCCWSSCSPTGRATWRRWWGPACCCSAAGCIRRR